MMQAAARACRTWGLCRFVPLLDVHVRIPALEHGGPFSVQGLDPSLQEQMRPLFRPLHLLPFTEAFAHHLVHRRLYETRRDRLAMTILVTIIWDQMRMSLR